MAKRRVNPAQTEAILESISDGVFTTDLEWRITSFNRAAEEITGVSRHDAIGRLCSEVFRSNMCGGGCALKKTLKTGKAVIGKSGYIINADGERVPVSVSTAVLYNAAGEKIGGAETFRDLSETEALRNELEGKNRVGDMASRSRRMLDIFRILPAVAASPSNVLIQGETGTGKELLARTIHDHSSRKNGPFIAVNCGALPDTLLESELFGYKAGAFTGAARDKPGRFALAAAGTLFLDEIGEVTPAMQVRLLRVLQERLYEPLGATRSEEADVRIICATNRNLAEEVREGRFREDLYYRLNVVKIDLPPLRLRKEDIPALTEQFVARFNRLQNKTVAGVSHKVLALFLEYDWPGNIRELENAVERAFILCDSGTIEVEHLSHDIPYAAAPAAIAARQPTPRTSLDLETLEAVLRKNNYNRLAAARELGIHKATLFRHMKKLGYVPPARDGRSRP